MSSARHNDSGSLTVADLLQHALVIELEAEQSYKDLAEQMDGCGNHDVAVLFTKMSALEGKHAQKIREHAKGIDLKEQAPWEYHWEGTESPESVELNEIHYLMKPHHALSLALDSERRAESFFMRVAKETDDAEVRSLAREFAEDEKQHATWMLEWLSKYPAPKLDWAEDLDPAPAVD